MKFRISVLTVRLNPHIETREVIDITVENTVVLANIFYLKTKNYTDGIVELKAKIGTFNVDEETINLFIKDMNGNVSYSSEGSFPTEEEDSIFSLYNQAEVAYFK